MLSRINDSIVDNRDIVSIWLKSIIVRNVEERVSISDSNVEISVESEERIKFFSDSIVFNNDVFNWESIIWRFSINDEMEMMVVFKESMFETRWLISVFNSSWMDETEDEI